ncbi:MAG: hypothetical protein ACPGOV_01470 [Magnetovibrionaceae bacterium]
MDASALETAKPNAYLSQLNPVPVSDDGLKAFGDDGFSFLDVVDMVNPLQHVPVVSTLYRELTGDEIGHVPRLVGGGLYFGALGLASAAVNSIIEEATGRDIGEHMVAMVTGDADDEPVAEDSMLAEGQESWSRPDLNFAHLNQGPGDDRQISDDEAARLMAAGEPFMDVFPTGAGQAGAPVDALASVEELAAFNTASGGLGRETASAGGRVAEVALMAGADSFEARAAAFYAFEARRDLVRDQVAAYERAHQQMAYLQTERTQPEGPRPAIQGDPGAIGEDGGWFSEAMLDGLIRADDSDNTNGAPEEQALPGHWRVY